MKQLNKTNNLGFILEVQLNANSTRKETKLDFLGCTILLYKPDIRRLVEQIKNDEMCEMIVPVVEREYSLKLSFDRYIDTYRIMDSERSIVLAYVSYKMLNEFANRPETVDTPTQPVYTKLSEYFQGDTDEVSCYV